MSHVEHDFILGEIEGVKNAILTAVKDAGPNACPPMVVGVGVGGTFEKCAVLAKKALTRFRSKNRYGIIAKSPANIQQKVTTQRPSPFLISFTDLICFVPGMMFLRVTPIINEAELATIKGKTAWFSWKMSATIIGIKSAILKYIIASEKVYAK